MVFSAHQDNCCVLRGERPEEKGDGDVQGRGELGAEQRSRVDKEAKREAVGWAGFGGKWSPEQEELRAVTTLLTGGLDPHQVLRRKVAVKMGLKGLRVSTLSPGPPRHLSESASQLRPGRPAQGLDRSNITTIINHVLISIKNFPIKS